MRKKTNLVTSTMKQLGISNNTLLTILSLIVLSGGTYGGYVIYKESETTSFQDSKPVYMSEVLDGDTFTIESGETIRLSEVDAPETNKCYGPQSTEALESLLRGKPLRLVKDITGSDNFGRLIRYVIIQTEDPTEDNILVNKYMIQNGFAQYEPYENNMYQRVLIDAEKSAQTKVLGIWKDCSNEIKTKPNRKVENNTLPSDPNCIIKGNISDLGFGKKYFLPHCANYKTIKVDPAKGESYFCSEEEAVNAGFQISVECQNRK